jgi:Cof subfamily protein (haloacid dehalogenase superfamily)
MPHPIIEIFFQPFTFFAFPLTFCLMPVKLLALDLDGTLLNSRGELPTRNTEAIAAARSLGVRVALVTGRRFRDARPLALELGLDVPVISHNGALTKHARTLETVAARLLPLDAAREVLRIARREKADAMISDDPRGSGLLIYDHISEGNQALAKYIAWSRRIVGDSVEETVRRVSSLEEYLDHEPIHIAFSGTCASIKTLIEDLRRDLGNSIQALSTMYPRQDFALLDVLHPQASKGAGLSAVAAEYNLLPEEVMAVGDNFNDLEMLRYAGTSVVMGNAEESLRKLIEGAHVTASNDEDGVALAIEQFILRDTRREETTLTSV